MISGPTERGFASTWKSAPYNILGMPGIDLIIFGQPVIARDSCECPFDNPPLGQHGERVTNFRGNLHRRLEQDLRVIDRVAPIPRVRGSGFDGRMFHDHRLDPITAYHRVRPVRGCHLHMEPMAFHVHADVPLSPLHHFFPRRSPAGLRR